MRRMHIALDTAKRRSHSKPQTNDSPMRSKGNDRLPRDRQAPQFLIPVNHIRNEC